MIHQGIEHSAAVLDPVSLRDMDEVKLMNRVDTKYVISADRLPDILERLKGYYRILEIDGIRIFQYDTLYLDTRDFLFFTQHVIGKPERHKVRYRTYRSTGVTFLEIKRKTSKNRTIKWRIENTLSDENRCDEAASEFIREYARFDPEGLRPVLMNQFRRITIVGEELNERATLDFDLSFSGTNGNHVDYPFLGIVELKRDGLVKPSRLAGIMKDFSVHHSGFSKYCFGLSVLYDIPRKNILKEKHLIIKKLENEHNKSVVA